MKLMKVRVVISRSFSEQERRDLAHPNGWAAHLADGKPMLSRDDLKQLMRLYGDPDEHTRSGKKPYCRWTWDDLYTAADEEEERKHSYAQITRKQKTSTDIGEPVITWLSDVEEKEGDDA
jgi:hypothetical protein